MKIYNIVLKGYSNQKTDRVPLSPLDIPVKTMIRILGMSAIITLLIGLTFIFLLKIAALYQLKNESSTRISLDKQYSDSSATSRQVVYYLLGATLSSKIQSAEGDINQILQKAFKGKDITFSSFVSYLNSIHPINSAQLADLIVGDIGFLSYEPKTADEIADVLNLKIDFTKDIKDDPNKLKRDIAISIILKFRDQLKSDVLKPLRLLIALDGRIQWLTFFAFVFCFIILTYRLYWAKMQLSLVVQPLPKDEANRDIDWLPGYKNNLFKINGEQQSLTKIRTEYKNLFLAQRYIDEVQDSLEQDVVQGKSIYDTLQQKNNWLKQAVEDGEYLIINFLLWLIPSLGFIGTIIGIIAAMEGASGIFEAQETLGQIIALQKVAASLGTAFDTTFVSLVLISVLMLYNAVVQKTEDLIFVRLDRVSSDYFIYELKYFGARKNTNA